MAETPNPERKSDSALLCFCIGAGLLIVSWFLGVGSVMGLALSGGNPAAIAGGLVAAIGIGLTAASGFVLADIGGIWIFVRVLADQAADKEERRYRNIER